MNTRSRIWIGSLLAIGMLSVFLSALTACGRSAEETFMNAIEPANAEAAGQSLIEARIVMARPEVFEKLERPPVVFDHHLHTESLKKEGCQVCHPPDSKGNVIYEFPYWEKGTDRDSLISAYHEKCMKCHNGSAKGDIEEAHGMGCGECHVDTLEYETVSWYPPAFDHISHIDAMEQGCDTCHHQYDEELGKLIYVKGQEQPCGECHKDKSDENIGSLRKVGHEGCIRCHEKKREARETKLDPYDCRICHRPKEKLRAPVPETLVERTYQSHPANLLISYPASILPPVPFDHEKHAKNEKENGAQNCNKACHNFHVRTIAAVDNRFIETGEACRQCHAKSEASIRSDSLTSDKTYHDKESLYSCIGCHTEEGKHRKDSKAPVECKGCHKGEGKVLSPVKVKMSVSSDEESPETSIIGRLSNKYLPVKFPHKMHSKMLDNCDSCHHHGPEKEKPACSTCHGAPHDFVKLTKPRLVSAYHRMCMGCHRSMGIGPVTCTKCHEEIEMLDSLAQLPEISNR